MFFSNAEKAFLISTMPKKIKIEVDFDIEDRVLLVTEDDDEVPAIITEITITKGDIYYTASRGLDEKLCFGFELKPAIPPDA